MNRMHSPPQHRQQRTGSGTGSHFAHQHQQQQHHTLNAARGSSGATGIAAATSSSSSSHRARSSFQEGLRGLREESERYALQAQPNGKMTRPDPERCFTFPVRLHQLLTALEDNNLTEVMSWQPHGRAFKVHDKERFVKEILPLWFRQSRYTSFTRQLNLYGFMRFSKGRDKSAYWHESFVRGRRHLSRGIRRVKIKGTGVRQSSCAEDEPDFYSDEFAPVGLEASEAGGNKNAPIPVPPGRSGPSADDMASEDDYDDHDDRDEEPPAEDSEPADSEGAARDALEQQQLLLLRQREALLSGTYAQLQSELGSSSASAQHELLQQDLIQQELLRRSIAAQHDSGVASLAAYGAFLSNAGAGGLSAVPSEMELLRRSGYGGSFSDSMALLQQQQLGLLSSDASLLARSSAGDSQLQLEAENSRLATILLARQAEREKRSAILLHMQQEAEKQQREEELLLTQLMLQQQSGLSTASGAAGLSAASGAADAALADRSLLAAAEGRYGTGTSISDEILRRHLLLGNTSEFYLNR